MIHSTYPAVVTTPRGTTVDRVKVFLVKSADQTGHRLLIYRDSAQGPSLVYAQAITAYTLAPPPARLRDMYSGARNTATLSTGGTVTWYRGSGCGCGSRLKTFDPFRMLDASTIPDAPFETEEE